MAQAVNDTICYDMLPFRAALGASLFRKLTTTCTNGIFQYLHHHINHIIAEQGVTIQMHNKCFARSRYLIKVVNVVSISQPNQ
jgi:hypothetical protein